MKKIIFFFVISFAVSTTSQGQIRRIIDSLSRISQSTISDSVKVKVLGQLAEYYFIFRLDKKADSCIQMQMSIAEVSNNNNLLVEALFGDAIIRTGTQISQETKDRIINFLQKGINFAQSKNDYDYMALAYSRMAFMQQRNADYVKAFSYATQALSATHNVTSDSIIAIVYIQLGDIYHSKSESKEAFSNYSIASDIAQKIDNYRLESIILHKFSEIYKSLNDSSKAADYLAESLKLNRENNDPLGMIFDYKDLIRLKNDTFLVQKALALCRTYNLYGNYILLKRLMLNLYYVQFKDYTRAIAYLNNDPELKASYTNTSISHYYMQIANAYKYSNMADSGIYYYTLAKPELVANYGKQLVSTLYSELATCFSMKGNYDSAIYYFERTLDMQKRMDNVSEIESISDSLSNLYALYGDYKLSYVYNKQSRMYKDVLKKLANDKDIALKEVERQRKMHELAIQAEAEKINRTRNLQYMAITIAITIVFVLFIFLGMFPISKLTIKIFGYFFFISLFEFLVLLIDNFIGRITNHQPLKIWLIKIFLIALLVPFQHFLEHGLIRFLSSRKLLEARQKLSFKKWWTNVKKPVPRKETDIEEGTAVL